MHDRAPSALGPHPDTIEKMRPWVVSGAVALLLACGGLDFSTPGLEGASHAEASAAGYSLPETATDIYAHDFSSIDARSTLLHYTLSEDGFAAEVALHRDRTDLTEHQVWRVPSSWPDYSGFGEAAEPPVWWHPAGDIVFEESQSATENEGSSLGSGSLRSFHAETRTVSIWMWQWEWWEADPEPAAEPVVVAVDEDLNAASAVLKCANGFRQHEDIKAGQVTFKGVPRQEECRLQVLGESPRSALLPSGRHATCRAAGNTMTCSES